MPRAVDPSLQHYIDRLVREGRHSDRFTTVCGSCREWCDGIYHGGFDGTPMCLKCGAAAGDATCRAVLAYRTAGEPYGPGVRNRNRWLQDQARKPVPPAAAPPPPPPAPSPQPSPPPPSNGVQNIHFAVPSLNVW